MADEYNFTFNTGQRLSLTAQSGLRSATDSLSQSLERLSSGLRINNASDDPAGVALAATTRTDSRVYAQAVRNVNDAINITNMASEGLSSLLEVAIRTEELATQATNSTLSHSQRQAIQEEADTLVDEFNRIIETTDWNDLKTYDGSLKDLTIQAGYGAQAAIQLALGVGLERNAGTGNFSVTGSLSGATSNYDVQLVDLNDDDKLDSIWTNRDAGEFYVALGNGDGTFEAQQTYSFTEAYMFTVADFNDDGKKDIAMMNAVGAGITMRMYWGDGDGTFTAGVSNSLMRGPGATQAVDLNGDSHLDLVVASGQNNEIYALLNDGAGNFSTAVTYTTGAIPRDVAIADVNNDSIYDLIVAPDSAGTGSPAASVLLGNGDGTFKAQACIAGITNVYNVIAEDFNRDGNIDLAFTTPNVSGTSTGDGLLVLMGNGDNTWSGPTIYTTGTDPSWMKKGDFNSDGITDLAVANRNSGSVGIYLGNSDGTFAVPSTTTATGTSTLTLAVGDINGDSVDDFLAEDKFTNSIGIYLADTQKVTTMKKLDLGSVADAQEALTTVEETLDLVNFEIGAVDAQSSRLSVAVDNLQSAQLGYDAAYHRIVDVDVAEEVANMVKAQIVGDSATAMLAQANQETAMVVKLLDGLVTIKSSK